MAKHSRTVYFFAVLIVAVSNVVFAPGYGPFSLMRKFEVGTYVIPATLANTDGSTAVLNSKTVVTSNPSAMDDKTNTPAAQTRSQPAAIGNANKTNTPVAQVPSQSKCDVRACSRAYHSFRESDCTYQPSGGPRRLCMEGVVAREPSGAPDTAARTNTNADVHPQPSRAIQHQSQHNRLRVIKLFGLTLPAIR